MATPSRRCDSLRNSGKYLVVFLSQAQRSSRNILLKMLDRGSPWNGQRDAGSPQEPSERYLSGARTMSLRDAVKSVPGNFTCSQREPRNKSNFISFTIFNH